MNLTPDIPENLDHLVLVITHDGNENRRARAANALYAAAYAAGGRHVIESMQQPIYQAAKEAACAT